MSVGRICSRDVDQASPFETVRQAADRMLQRQVGSLVVLDEERRPIGILTDRDLVTRVLAAGKNPNATRVEEVMTTDPDTATEDTPIESALSLMRSGLFRRLPIVDDAGALVGLVSLNDILTLMAEELTVVGELLNQQTPRSVSFWA